MNYWVLHKSLPVFHVRKFRDGTTELLSTYVYFMNRLEERDFLQISYMLGNGGTQLM